MKSSTALDLIGEQHDVQGGSLTIHHVCLVKYRKHDAPQPVWGISWYVLMMQSHQLCLTVCACCTNRCMMLGSWSIDHHDSTCQHTAYCKLHRPQPSCHTKQNNNTLRQTCATRVASQTVYARCTKPQQWHRPKAACSGCCNCTHSRHQTPFGHVCLSSLETAAEEGCATSLIGPTECLQYGCRNYTHGCHQVAFEHACSSALEAAA